ncbi:hypothetical protein HGRIS_013574 [Hohenbuehelia grisea]|uniref:DUF6534 domain-containing protein n=1 Tax=Hohenbuehelia grisea TaxID=104357 RepID=A0ABR3IW52_9AGAR
MFFRHGGVWTLAIKYSRPKGVVYFQLVTNFGNTSVLRALSTDWVIEGIFIPLVSLPTQLYFTHRIWIFSGKKWIFPAIFVPASLFHLAGRIAFTILSLRAPGGSDGPAVIQRMAQLQIAFWAIAAAEDILISAVLIKLIWERRPGDDEIKSTRDILRRLILLSINTGVWTALDALFTIILLVAYPTKFYFAALVFVQAPLYANSLLANLNARSFVRGKASRSRSGFTEPDNIIELSGGVNLDSTKSAVVNVKVDPTGSFRAAERSKTSEATSTTYVL